jgi:hypothetical protein
MQIQIQMNLLQVSSEFLETGENKLTNRSVQKHIIDVDTYTNELTTGQFIEIDNRGIDELTTYQFINAVKKDTVELTIDQFTDTDTV